MSDIKNTSDLRKMLLETIDGVRSGSIDHRQASAISGLSSRVLQSAKLDLEAIKMDMKNNENKKSKSHMLIE